MYRGVMSLRQVWVRIRALPGDSPLHVEIREAEERAAAEKRSADLDDALSRYKPKG